jgi:hypothetical protein
LAAILSDIAAFERNHFPLRELMAENQAFHFAACGGPGNERWAFSHRIGRSRERRFLGRPAGLFNKKLIWLAVILLVAAGAWKMFSGHGAGRAEGQTVGTNFATTASLQPSSSSDTDPVLSAPQFDAAPAASPEAAPVNGLKISSQSWRRGGLGSKALVTFTLRNDNDYAVGDIGLLCAFTRADGSPVTERRSTIHDTVKMKSRKTFARMHVGFINVNASRAKCTLLSASRV